MAAGRRWTASGVGRAMLAFSVLSMLPDLDVVGMRLGVPYGAPWGHRGATHSLAMAVALGLAFAWWMRERGDRFGPTAVLAIAVTASHGLLDAMTDGGKGVALLWPVTAHRYFLPWRPIPVAPIGVGMLSGEGLEVAGWELVVFSPLLVYALWPRVRR
jgi:inner membrane protein